MSPRKIKNTPDKEPVIRVIQTLILLLITITHPTLAVNDPGHDQLYIEEQGSSELNGSLNITQNLSVSGGLIKQPGGLILYGDGTLPSTGPPYITGTNTNHLYLDAQGNIYIKYTIGGDTVYIGKTGAATDLNVSGALHVQSSTATINGQNICLEDGTNCPAGANQTGNITGSGLANRVSFWTNSNTLNYDNNLTWDNNNKRLGIGTNNPSEKLHIKGDILLTNGALKFINTTAPSPQLALYRGGTGFAILRRYGEDYTILQIWSPPETWYNASEATIALVRGDEPNQEYIDIYNNGYTTETQYGIRMQKRGTGQYRDFVFDYYDGTTKKEVMRIKPTGRIGINTTSPNTTLHVNGNINATRDICEETTGKCLSQTGTGNGDITAVNTQGKYLYGGTTTGDANLYLNETQLNTTIDARASTSGGWTDLGNTINLTNPNDNINANTLFIDNTNNRVGIGTTSPVTSSMLTLEDSGDVHIYIKADSDNTGEGDNPEIHFFQDDEAEDLIIGVEGNAGTAFTNSIANAAYIHAPADATGLQLATEGAAALTITEDGKVGVGDSVPDAKLDILNTESGDSFRVDDSSDGENTPFIINADGEVGIGTENPGTYLHVQGSQSPDILFEETTTGSSLQVELKNTARSWWIQADSDPDLFSIQDRTTAGQPTRFSIDSSGNIGINTTSPNATLHVEGTSAFKGNMNISGYNISSVNCIYFDSGGKICSGS